MGQNQPPAAEKPKSPKKERPKDFASMMQQFEKASLDKKEEERQKEEEEAAAAEQYNDYGNEYGYYDQIGAAPNMNAQGLLGHL
jgi:hypothetical protein